jgi:hypothetical protein
LDASEPVVVLELVESFVANGISALGRQCVPFAKV